MHRKDVYAVQTRCHRDTGTRDSENEQIYLQWLHSEDEGKYVVDTSRNTMQRVRDRFFCGELPTRMSWLSVLGPSALQCLQPLFTGSYLFFIIYYPSNRTALPVDTNNTNIARNFESPSFFFDKASQKDRFRSTLGWKKPSISHIVQICRVKVDTGAL